MRLWAVAFAAMLLVPGADAAAPDRTVHGTSVVSRHGPAVTVTLPATAHYLGADRFVLTDPKMGPFDDCELHAFVEPDGHGQLRKLYWVQFEAYLPRVPNIHHTYDSPRHVTLGGLDFYVDSWVSNGKTPPEPGSDTEHLDALLKAHGLSRGDMMTVRLVHLPDAAKRTELMVIYSEAVPPGLTADALKKGGAAYGKWPALDDGLVARAINAVHVQPR